MCSRKLTVLIHPRMVRMLLLISKPTMLLKAKPNVTFSVSSGWATGRTFVSWLSLIFRIITSSGLPSAETCMTRKKTPDTVYTVPQEALAAEPEVAQVGTMGQFHEFMKIAQAGPTWQILLQGTWEHVSVPWYQVEYQLWANCFMCWMPVANSGPKFSGNSTTTVAAVLSERPNPEPWPIRQKRVGASQGPDTWQIFDWAKRIFLI